MIDEGHIDRFNRKEGKAREEAGRYVDLEMVEHTDARNVGAEWLCKQGLVPGVNMLYDIPDKLFALKDELETHLCNRTDHLSNLENRIVLFDLTNFYFEGRKKNSCKAKFGRCKEKRSDCRLLVMMLEQMDFDYLCVSRTRLKDYVISPDCNNVEVSDCRGRKITLCRVEQEEGGDIFYEVASPSKTLTKTSMNRMWKERFEEELLKINGGINCKGGMKRYEKVVERTGRAIERYPSIARFYRIEYVRDEQQSALMKEVRWTLKDLTCMQRGTGVYFLRANMTDMNGRKAWDYYIREIEATNRQLKTDLNLRLIYHRKDSRSDAHLFFDLLAYWVAGTIRHQLKLTGETAYWTEIVRRMEPQKLVTTQAVNALGEKVTFRACSRPTKEALAIYQALDMKPAPFIRVKICSTLKPPG